MNALVSQILPQLQSKVASSLFNRAHAIEWLTHGSGLQSSVSLNTAKRFESALDKYTVEVTGVTFVAGPEEDAIPAHQNILRKLKRVRFKNCTFECDHLSLPGVTQWFENCRFSADWSVSCAKCDHGYTEQGDSLFEDCVFEGSVSVHRPKVDGNSLGQYSGVFWECSAQSLTVFDVDLRTRLWYTMDLPWERRQHLGELTIMNTNATWPIELSHQNIASIHIHRCTLAGIDFAGGNADKMTISDSELSGGCKLEMAGVKELFLSDTTFTRPVNCDTATIGSFVALRVDFEKVLGCASTTIEDEILLSSVRYTVPPDFLGITLTECAKASSDRETFRLIKHSFEAVANRIEASRFFGLEMQAYQRELKERAPWYSRERLLVAFNHAVSRHGQSYIRPLMLLLATAVINAWLIASDGWQVSAGLLIITEGLNSFAKGFTLFNPVMHPGMEFASLVLAALMSTFLWHFLVAVRRFR